MKVIRGFVLALMVLLAALLTGCSGSNDGHPGTSSDDRPPAALEVVTTTTLIQDIVQDIGLDKVQVTNIIPPGSCPGHFDVKPGDLRSLAEARLFLLHNWQGESFADDLINSAGGSGLQKAVLNLEGNWMVPAVRIKAIDMVTELLTATDPANAEFYLNNAQRSKNEAETTGDELHALLKEAAVDQTRVLCADMQAGFAEWTGMQITGVFGRPEDTTPQQWEELIAKARSEGVTLVVDNLQSGSDGGAQIARELGVKHVVLTNFPGGFPNTDSWDEAVRHNVQLILEAHKQ